MTEMLEKPNTKAEECGAGLDPRLADAVRVIVEKFNGDADAFFESIRPKERQDQDKAERQERQLLETAYRCF